MPTGGVNANNLNNYLANPKVVCCGGSWIVDDKLIKAQDWQGITNLCKQAVSKMLDFQLAHVGVNCADASLALATANLLQNVFGWQTKQGNSSVFASDKVECMSGGGRGTLGHIAVSTPNVKRAMAQLANNGVQFDEQSIKQDKNGKIVVVYLQQEIAGFAIHLVERK